MTQNRQTIVILCEDRQQYVFARYFLQKKGLTGKFIDRSCPSGRQAGEQYVRERYALEVKAHRSKNYLNICLIVVIDADKGTVAERIKQLDSVLEEKRHYKEKIAIFVPRRNIRFVGKQKQCIEATSHLFPHFNPYLNKHTLIEIN